MRGRITRRELKEDELRLFLRGIKEFFIKHGEKLKIGLVAGGLIALFLIIFFLTQQRMNANAQSDFSAAMAIYQQENLAPQEKFVQAKDGFKNVVDKYPRASIKKVALFYLGNCSYFLGEYAQAQEYLKKCIKASGRHFPAVQAREGLGKAYEAEGSFLRAIQAYKEIEEKYPRYFLIPKIIMDKGRCYENLGKIEEARENYQRILDFYPQSAWVEDAGERINLLAQTGKGLNMTEREKK